MLDALIHQLTQIATARASGYVQQFEAILGQIAALNDPSSIARLLPFLDDREEYDEMMFSIIHTIERFDDKVYVHEIVHNLSSLLATSPRWATIIHMRILNSPATLSAYADRMRTLSTEERKAVASVLGLVRQKHVKFEARCDTLLATL